MATFTVQRTIAKPRADVWALLGDFTSSPGPGVTVQVEKEGDRSQGGAGTIRTITVGNVRVREIIDAVTPPYAFTYRILEGAPMKDYKADVTLEEVDGTTVIRWQASLKPKIPLTGGICCSVAKGTVNKLIDAVEKALRTR
jgi:carbon monoxide dehydrogenase subunit G